MNRLKNRRIFALLLAALFSGGGLPGADENGRPPGEGRREESRSIDRWIAEAEKASAESGARDRPTTHRKDFMRAAWERIRRDSGTFTPEQRDEIEALYAAAKGKRVTEEAKGQLRTLIEKYPKANRSGGARLRLAQWEAWEGGEGMERELRAAIEKHDDCWLGNGVHVGAFARYLLLQHYCLTGREAEAEDLLREIVYDFPGAIDHGGGLLSDRIAGFLKSGLPSGEPVPGGEEVVISGEGIVMPGRLYLPEGAGPFPEGKGPFPAAVVLPGGGGPKRVGRVHAHDRHFGARLAERGIAALVLEYGHPDRSFLDPLTIRDIGAAVDFLKKHETVRKDALFLVGFSMGGANALRAAGSRDDIAGLVCYFAPNDWRIRKEPLPIEIEKQPVDYCPGVSCPVLILHGDADRVTEIGQARHLHKKLKELGKESTLIVYEGAGHGFTYRGICNKRIAWDEATAERSLNEVERFIKAGARKEGEEAVPAQVSDPVKTAVPADPT